MHVTTWIPLLAPLAAAYSVPFGTEFARRQLPHEPTGVKTIQTANNVTIRYKEPGKAGVCETTPGVNSYAGYVDLAEDAHTFFWFFEARHDPKNAPITLWLNGGPGSDSLIGLFEELGPCHVNEQLETYINPHSFNEISNMLFISQPLGTGFSYATEEVQVVDGHKGRYPAINATLIDTTNLAAEATWEVLQAFLGALPKLDSNIKSKSFNLWTESYGGHYGPAVSKEPEDDLYRFFDHFYKENEKIANGTVEGIHLDFNTLGIINGIIDEAIQAPHYPEFAVNNTYGIKTVNDTVYNYMKFANAMPGGCQDQVASCKATNRTSLSDLAICTEAADMCRDNGPYYVFSGRGTYDIRHPSDDPTPPTYYEQYLEKGWVKNALGVDLNYTGSNNDVYYAFQQTGDFVWPNFIEDLEDILTRPSALLLSMVMLITFATGSVHRHEKEFKAAGYAPFLVDGVEYGETREYGNFSFTRVYEAGHEVPYYQPIAALQLFNRTLNGWELPNGLKKLSPGYGSSGPATATHTESSVALPSSTSTPSPSSGVAAMKITW
ncbi:hypothetical protein N7468_001962 [Penicillium chermesinum]|uniref:Carboxypeptidase n=1 Tax=Penicillium chermesinum TaxID=63820 RepID=A0A9W9PHJ1_9EURO|nr:uncharacterized protein N7468_001962 [Penicillium chermesinum]KAJ5246979.1 hypothetical protein N7468_001962 [Penicillium chermesinum]